MIKTVEYKVKSVRFRILHVIVRYLYENCTRFVVVDPQGTYYGTGLGGTCSYSPPSMPPVSQHINKLVALNAPQFFGSLSCGMCFRVSFALEKNPQSKLFSKLYRIMNYLSNYPFIYFIYFISLIISITSAV